jgi:glycosyltransferase involved in cell wall biosynthesis
MTGFDILAYPCTFEETSCIAVIDALCAGLRVICSSIGALPETTEGWARIYSYEDDRISHAETFAKILEEEIENIKSGALEEQLAHQADSYNDRWCWDGRIEEWIKLFDDLK